MGPKADGSDTARPFQPHRVAEPAHRNRLPVASISTRPRGRLNTIQNRRLPANQDPCESTAQKLRIPEPGRGRNSPDARQPAVATVSDVE